MRFRYCKGREDCCHAVGRATLVSAFGAVADVEDSRSGLWGREFDLAALAGSFHLRPTGG